MALAATSDLTLCVQPSGTARSDLIARAAKVAETAYERVASRFMTFLNVQLPYVWSYRLLQIELQKDGKPAKKVQALKAHLERMSNLNRVAGQLAAAGRLGSPSLLSAEYYLTQAECRAAPDDLQRRQAAGAKIVELCQRRYKLAWQDVTSRVESNALIIAPALSGASQISQEWANAAIEFAPLKRDRLEAAKSYLQRAKEIEEVARRFFANGSIAEVCEAAFFCADAELQVNLNHGGPHAEKRERQLRKARRDAAEGVYSAIWDDIRNYHGSYERLYRWSTLLRCASLSLAANDVERLDAVAAHRARMINLKKFFDGAIHGASIDMEQASEFYCLEAEIMFAQAKAKVPPQ
jgi:hypothetical protein